MILSEEDAGVGITADPSYRYRRRQFTHWMAAS